MENGNPKKEEGEGLDLKIEPAIEKAAEEGAAEEGGTKTGTGETVIKVADEGAAEEGGTKGGTGETISVPTTAQPLPVGPVTKPPAANGPEASAADTATEEVANVPYSAKEDVMCWDLKTKGYCPRLQMGIRCPWEHPGSMMGGANGIGLLNAYQKLMASAATSTPSVVQNINATSELPDVEGKTLDCPEFVDVPEHLAGAISGSMRMKRFLEIDMEEGRQEFQHMDLVDELGSKAKEEGLDEPFPKKRRLVTLERDSLCQWHENEDEDVYMPYNEEEELKMEKIEQILKRWKLTDNFGARYALETVAYMPEIEKMVEHAHWKPDINNQMHSVAEQIINRIRDSRIMGLPLFAVDAVKTFTFKWGLAEGEAEQLSKLDWNQFRYVTEFYDGTTNIEDLVEASKKEDDPWGVGLPGVQSQIRTMRLELIDGSSDCLVLGDANLTFSSLLSDHRAGLGHTGKVIATTFEDFKTLSIRYKELARTIKNLLKNDAQVWHGVDCTRLAVDPRFHGFEEAFGAVYYNFPHAGAVKGFYDSHPFVNWRHANLMALFFRAISYFVKPGAIVKVSSNAKAKGVQAQYIIMAGEYSDFMHIETFAFTDWVLRRYHRSYGDKRDEKVRPGADSYTSQQAAADMVYCFRYMPTGQNEAFGVPIKQPPQICDFINDVWCCACGYICQKEMVPKQRGASGAINSSTHFQEIAGHAHSNLKGKNKRKMVLEFYQRFLTEASGIHIG